MATEEMAEKAVKAHNRFSSIWAAFALIVVVAGPDLCRANSQTRFEDPRLGAPVSLTTGRITIADAVNEISRQTGVLLRTDGRDPGAQEHIAVHLRGVSLADAMDALKSLLSYRSAQWEWRKEQQGRTPVYSFIRSMGAKRLAVALDAWIQEKFEEQASLLLKAALMHPEERADFVKRNAEAISPENPAAAVEHLNSDWSWAGLSVFQECLPEEMRISVLRGAGSPQFPVSGLSDRGRAFVRKVWSGMNARMRKNGGPWEPVPEPRWIRFITAHAGETAAPCLFVEMEQIGGSAYIGGSPIEDAHVARLERLWKSPGDSPTHPLEECPLPGPPAASIKSENSEAQLKPPFVSGRLAMPTGAPFARRTGELSEIIPVSILARLPREDGRDPGPPIGRKLRDYLAILKDPFRIMMKWRGDILLLSSTTWHRYEISRVSPDMVRELRTVRETNEGLIPLKFLIETINKMTQAQVGALQGEFPEVQAGFGLREVFSIVSSSPLRLRQILSQSGLYLSEDLRKQLLATSTYGKRMQEQGWKAIRLRSLDDTSEDGVRRRVVLEVFSSSGEWNRVSGFFYRSSPRRSR